MIKKKLLFNGIKVGKKEVDLLLKKYPVKDIETSLIKIFLERNNFVTKNELLLSVIRKNHENIKIEIDKFLKEKDIILNLKTIEGFFELLIEPQDRKLNGSFYTPSFIVDCIINETISDNEKVCDLSCGSGAFLVQAIQKIHNITNKPIIKIIEENIFGGDISGTSIYRSKIILSLLALTYGEDKKNIKFNLREGDSLTYNWLNKNPEGFDVIIGNPPYVRIQNLPKQSRESIKQKYFTASKGNIDLFIPFFELGIRLLSENGKMGYITPNSYINSRASKKLREYLKDNGFIKKIIDFNHLQLFEGAITYTCITILDKERKNKFKYRVIHKESLLDKLDKLRFAEIKLSNLNNEKWNLLNPEDYENIKKIESIGVPLGKVTQIKNGIATLKDNLYILNGKTKNGFYIINYKGKRFPIEKKVTRKIIKASRLKKQEDIDKAKTRIIFPYEKDGKVYKPISERKLKKDYPKCYEYFLEIKNELSKRDKGSREYKEWFAYGRVQGYNINGAKIITPVIAPEPRFFICNENKTLYNGGIGIFYKGDTGVLIKILNSKVFWYYVLKTSKEYQSHFMSMSKNFIEKFNIPRLKIDEINFLKRETSKQKIDNFLIRKYDLTNI